ncbi:YdaS family helix-turn-helix protein [Acidithiobacillus ferriphilus]|uniref:Helix-turn-helix domain-containing protein n=2 Tax=Acidithiobacillus TaxID=119977 RepID=A0A179BI07_ACIFR|nr:MULTISPECIES: YdaS family helix-turn-helix protein [Acidithiobacillus]MEB8488352.1 YdaS family helix-turn-helix protein [Acidithiobacillus ferriphilus]MEB8557297.1 YdaS family helix-turn-helix protein [Acidithiobacillus ferriphilus]MEB8586636.1 YdaS family helix-turn-helix protein [Acidithiobacillus ferriphilus]OAP90963.1 hypothetical protein A4H96_08975 [Acidithiobacillus ferrooxidans]
MNLKAFIVNLTIAEKRALAEHAGTKLIYLHQIAGGFSAPSARLAIRVERATNGVVTREELRPDIFGPPFPAQGDTYPQAQGPESDPPEDDGP